MLEPEVANASMEDIIDLAVNLLKYLFEYLLKECDQELTFLANKNEINLKERLSSFLKNKYHILDYKDAIQKLIVHKDKAQFENMNIFFGMDLNSEHERYLTEVIYENEPVCVINYPSNIKAFYMRSNEDNKTVQAFDLLLPGIGEMIGGSVREERYEHLLQKINEKKIPSESLN